MRPHTQHPDAGAHTVLHLFRVSVSYGCGDVGDSTGLGNFQEAAPREEESKTSEDATDLRLITTAGRKECVFYIAGFAE